MNLLECSRFFSSKQLFQIGTDNDAVIAGDPEKRQETDPDGNTQVDRMNLKQISHISTGETEIEKPILTIKPQHDESAGPGDQNSAEYNQGNGNLTKLEIQNQEDNHEGEWQDDPQASGGPDLVFVITGE